MALTTDQENAKFQAHLQSGAQLHNEGQLEAALAAFQSAWELRPEDTNAACAYATLLTALSRPQAAYKTLLALEASLLTQPDGAANLAIAAENSGDMSAAKNAYLRALELNPNQLRSLNNMGLLAAGESDWSNAIAYARRCVELEPNDASYRQNLADFLSGDMRYSEALAVLNQAAKQFPDYVDITIRRIIVLACQGEFEKSRQLENTLAAAGQNHLQAFVSRLLASSGHATAEYDLAPVRCDAFDIYICQVFNAIKVCDWRGNEKLTEILLAALSGSANSAKIVAWQDAEFCARALSLRDNELTKLQRLQVNKKAHAAVSSIPVFKATRKTLQRQQDQRIHVGLVVHQLHQAQHLCALEQQLALHDKSRFAFHVYSSTRQPGRVEEQSLLLHAHNVVQIAHMSDLEVVGRIRLDQLDVFVDTAYEPGSPRPNIAQMRLAPVQVCQTSWQRHRQPEPYDYVISDRHVHPHSIDNSDVLARLPLTCWLTVNDTKPSANSPSRLDIGLPTGALVLCALFEPVKLDTETFTLWMQILESLPHAVLWLPGCNELVRAHLSGAAQAAGIHMNQIIFSGVLARSDMLAAMKQADLFLDTLRFNAVQGLEDALRMGIPAISCEGSSKASRLGGSLLRAAGLPECVVDTQEAYAAGVIRLGQNPIALKTLRQRLDLANESASLFDVASRIKEWEAAWTVMVERSRSGLLPETFDVPLAVKSS
jgi:protein O-GlcNAc transferase